MSSYRDNPPRHMVTESEASDRLGVPAKWLQREAMAGRLPMVQAGKSRMYPWLLLTEAMNKIAADQQIERRFPTPPPPPHPTRP